MDFLSAAPVDEGVVVFVGASGGGLLAALGGVTLRSISLPLRGAVPELFVTCCLGVSKAIPDLSIHLT